ncbi:exocyst complex component 3-like protein 4 [Alligator mississippiensis]|uniref:exocyst complex component 3-like protein 4 n=1 Tax=Alligator mississippiensis TaxID=8496 RepID=UPI0028775B10|nr:exocyst complex component 3-like protein 4 [Alligator mississippiensis]XP_014451950.2 exocyst complex component 3-like protein 4 [Alligator mississippiensis]XP_019337105.2 exocyst complex component 3-like protein 4 [Alligator mississippiensis]XP_019337106.2 exocyst complex component 3-like protein 4 [Alligator mississippiensis]XP_019337107.2 exocyst complex component 3-like protein 4 [Alligator mississippiensis]
MIAKMDEDKKETPVVNEKRKSVSKPVSPGKSPVDEKADSGSTVNDSLLNSQGEKNVTSPIKDIKNMLTLTRDTFGNLRRSKRLSLRRRNSKSNEEDRHLKAPSMEECVEEAEAEPVKQEPLSVMEINELIQQRQLLKAFQSIKYLEDEIVTEMDGKDSDDKPTEFSRKVKDVDLLYNSIANEIKSIVKNTLDHPSIEEKLLTLLVELIAEEEKAHGRAEGTESPEPHFLGMPRKWREVWKDSVKESAEGRVLQVPMTPEKDKDSWLAVHLGFLRKNVREDLLKIKHSVQKCYPEDYKVCDTYVECFHNAISSHLQGLLQRHLEFNELYALLDWVANMYRSEALLGCPCLQPEVKTENLPLLLPPATWEKLKNDYTDSLKEKIKCYFDNILKLEITEKWEKELQPEVVQNQYNSSLYFDIQTIIAEHMKTSGKISTRLGTAVLEICLVDLKEYIPRFVKVFLEWDKEKDFSLFLPYLAAYINSFHDLITGLQTNFAADTKELEKILADVTMNFRKCFLNKLEVKTQPLFKKILSKTWVSSDEILNSILSTTVQYSQDLNYLRQPTNKDFLRDVHRYLVREYIAQALKPRKKIKRSQRQKVSKKMKEEATVITETLSDLGSDSDELSLAISVIADIISEKKKEKIQAHLQSMRQRHRDLRNEHIVAILALRGFWRKTRENIIQHLGNLKEDAEIKTGEALFAEIETPTIVSCL